MEGKIISLLDSNVSRQKFANAVKELNSVEDSYADIWKLRYIKYPTILIDVLSSLNEPAITLHLNLDDWDFLPPRATLVSLNLRQQLTPQNVPGAVENPAGSINHIVWNKDINRLWFCSPGFYEYHEFYFEDRWELIRGTDQGKITWIVERACNLIDRSKLG